MDNSTIAINKPFVVTTVSIPSKPSEFIVAFIAIVKDTTGFMFEN